MVLSFGDGSITKVFDLKFLSPDFSILISSSSSSSLTDFFQQYVYFQIFKNFVLVITIILFFIPMFCFNKLNDFYVRFYLNFLKKVSGKSLVCIGLSFVFFLLFFLLPWI